VQVLAWIRTVEKLGQVGDAVRVDGVDHDDESAVVFRLVSANEMAAQVPCLVLGAEQRREAAGYRVVRPWPGYMRPLLAGLLPVFRSVAAFCPRFQAAFTDR
jgi:hypothetical protein